jgi:hypothetical protein
VRWQVSSWWHESTPASRGLETVMNEIESMEALFSAKFDALHNEIEALRLLKQHDIASIQLRFQDSREALDTALATARRFLLI